VAADWVAGVVDTVGSGATLQEGFHALGRAGTPVTPIVGATLPLEKLNRALAMARAEEVFGRIVLDVSVSSYL
jgi:D-arabinose 1-dehydrogenase-like Zn-dependent alcohol dehydrogenase